MAVLVENDYCRFQELLQELNDALVVQQLRNKWQGQPTQGRWIAWEKIVGAAVSIMRSDFASLQMLYPERGTGGELRLLAFRGFNPQAARFWEWVRPA